MRLGRIEAAEIAEAAATASTKTTAKPASAEAASLKPTAPTGTAPGREDTGTGTTAIQSHDAARPWLTGSTGPEQAPVLLTKCLNRIAYSIYIDAREGAYGTCLSADRHRLRTEIRIPCSRREGRPARGETSGLSLGIRSEGVHQVQTLRTISCQLPNGLRDLVGLPLLLLLLLRKARSENERKIERLIVIGCAENSFLCALRKRSKLRANHVSAILRNSQ